MYNVSKVQVDQGTVKRKIARYLEQHNKSRVFVDKFRGLDAGYCSGMTVLWLYAKWLQTQTKADFSANSDVNPLKLTPNDDYEWFKSTTELISSWNEKTPLTPEESKQFERFASLVEYYQHIYERLSSAHQYSLEGFLEDPRKGAAKREYSIASLFTLEQLKQLLKIENFIQDSTLILIGSHNHGTGLFKKEGAYYYFDSNSYDGETQATSTDELAKLIFEANFYNLGKSDCKVVAPYHTKPSPLGFIMFSFNENTAEYPNQADVLNSINPSLIPEKKHAYEETGLTTAASIGCLESVQYFLSKKVNPSVQGKYTALMYASARGYTDIATELLAAGANPNTVLTPINNKVNRWTAIMLASYAGYADIVIKLLVAGADPNKYDSIGATPLIMAVMRNHVAVVKALVASQNLNPNLKDKGKMGHTALMYAAMENRTEIVKVLLTNQKIDVNIKGDSNGCTAIMLAVMFDCPDVVKILLTDKKIDLNAKAKKFDFTPFTLAIGKNKFEIVKAILASQLVDPNAKDEKGMTALMRASINGYADIVAEILASGADPNIVTNYGHDGTNAFMMAADRGNVDVVKIFLTNKNINLNAQDETGTTALILATEKNLVETVKVLLTNSNVDPNIKGGLADKTALMYAAEENYVEIVKALLANPRVDPNIMDGLFGQTALMDAAGDDHVGIIKILLATPNVDPNAQDELLNCTALMWAIEDNCVESVKELLKNPKVDINIQSASGNIAIILAVIKKHTDIIKALMIHKNIDLSIRNIDGKTAFDYAETDEVKQLLKKPSTMEYMAKHNMKIISSEKEKE